MEKQKLTSYQMLIFRKMEPGKIYSAYKLQTKLATLRAMQTKGFIRDVTSPGAGGLFSPTTHFQFIRVERT